MQFRKILWEIKEAVNETAANIFCPAQNYLNIIGLNL
jgi:hypothetical protein